MNRRSASADEIAQDLQSKIIRGDFPEGSRLPSERELATSYLVSRPTVREALRRLADRQLIRVEPARGSFVESKSLVRAAAVFSSIYERGDVTPRDVVEARIGLESTAASLAADRATRAEVGALGQTLVGLERAADRLERVQYDLAFHFGVVRAAHNPVVEAMFASISHLAVELMLRSVDDPHTRDRSSPFHRLIFRAVSEGRPDAAREAVRAHLAVAIDTYGDDYNRRLDAMAHRALERISGPRAELGKLLDDILPEALRDL